jgi:hypothetical protein
MTCDRAYIKSTVATLLGWAGSADEFHNQILNRCFARAWERPSARTLHGLMRRPQSCGADSRVKSHAEEEP